MGRPVYRYDPRVALPEFVPVGPRRTFEGAVQQIADRIRLGDIGPGDRLPSERDLAAALQISRPTLREAVQVLVDAGVVTVRRGAAGGIFVTSGYVPLDLVRSKSDMRLSEVSGVLESRRLVEPRVVQLAALRARDDDIAALHATIEAQRSVIADGDVLASEDRFLQLDTQFHLRLARATGNTTIVSLMRTLLGRLEIARDMAVHDPPVPSWAVDIHQRTLDAVQAADHARIDEVMDEHLSALERAWERETDRLLVRPLPDFLLPLAERSTS
jgi:GntR family transcriptional repressor for pyruvate dehydrogenase complex